MRFVLVGNPESNRVAFFQEALARRGLAPAAVVSWLGLLAGRERLEDALAGPGPVTLRLESPGKDFAVERELIAWGADDSALGDAARTSPAEARALEEDVGRIRFLRQRHLGLVRALAHVEDVLRAHPDVRVMTAPRAVVTMFDKPACHARLREAGVSVPRALGPVGSWSELRAAMQEARLPRVFVKPSYSSSAAGVIALATQGPRIAAHTTVELVREAGELRLYASRRVRRYTSEADVAAIVDALGPEGVHVEEWVPKAGFEGKACDLRLVVVGGRAQHAVVRTSQSPLTNLHLLNPRGDLDAFVAMLGPERWGALQRLGEAALAAVGDALYAGVDLCVARGLTRQVVLEVNAFGDLLPRVMVDGRDTYTAEVDAVMERAA